MIIFDCDGVLVDSMLLHTESESLAYKSIGIEIESSELVRRFSGVDLKTVNQILSHEYGVLVPDTFNKVVQEQKIKRFNQELLAIDHIQQVLDELSHRQICVASGSPLDEVFMMLDIVGLSHFFKQNIFTAEMVKKGKPDPALFALAIEKNNKSVKECLVVEDAQSGVVAAKQIDIPVLGFYGASHCSESHGKMLLDSGANAVFSDMRLLPGLVIQYI